LLGATRVSLRGYLIGTCTMLPATAVPVYLGALGRTALTTGRGERGVLDWLLLGAGALATVFTSLWLSRAAAAKLRDLTANEGRAKRRPRRAAPRRRSKPPRRKSPTAHSPSRSS
jgi:hypothetical protein